MSEQIYKQLGVNDEVKIQKTNQKQFHENTKSGIKLIIIKRVDVRKN